MAIVIRHVSAVQPQTLPHRSGRQHPAEVRALKKDTHGYGVKSFGLRVPSLNPGKAGYPKLLGRGMAAREMSRNTPPSSAPNSSGPILARDTWPSTAQDSGPRWLFLTTKETVKPHPPPVLVLQQRKIFEISKVFPRQLPTTTLRRPLLLEQ